MVNYTYLDQVGQVAIRLTRRREDAKGLPAAKLKTEKSVEIADSQ
jgi:hypothetical protein